MDNFINFAKWNKNDKIFENEISLSSKTGEGFEKLKSKILELTNFSNLSSNTLIITNERHKNALIRANESLVRAIDNITDDTLDLVSIDIKQAYLDLGEITGSTSSEEIIDAIFSKFCLGK